MIFTNNYAAPLVTDDDDFTVLIDDLGNVLLADWHYKEV